MTSIRPSGCRCLQVLAWAALVVGIVSCGGGGGGGGRSASSPTAPPAPAPTPQPASIGGYGSQPCCCGFWTYTFTQEAQEESWICWGWIEVRSQSGTAVSGYTNMEKNADDCPDFGRCVNGSSGVSAGELDSSGTFRWRHGVGDWYSRGFAESRGCSVVSDPEEIVGRLVDGQLEATSTAVLSCGGKTAQLTLTARGTRGWDIEPGT